MRADIVVFRYAMVGVRAIVKSAVGIFPSVLVHHKMDAQK